MASWNEGNISTFPFGTLVVHVSMQPIFYKKVGEKIEMKKYINLEIYNYSIWSRGWHVATQKKERPQRKKNNLFCCKVKFSTDPHCQFLAASQDITQTVRLIRLVFCILTAFGEMQFKGHQVYYSVKKYHLDNTKRRLNVNVSLFSFFSINFCV